MLFFAADDGVNGKEIWRSTGSESGTKLLADVVDGSGGSDPADLRVAGPLVFFSATQDETGMELFAVPATPIPAVIEIQGTATGGIFMVSPLPGVSVEISTANGESAATVATHLAAAINADAAAQATGVSAVVVGSSVILVGTDAALASYSTSDLGLGGSPASPGRFPPAISSGVLVLVALLASGGWLKLRSA